MIPGPFDYHAPDTLAGAISLLEQHGDDARVLSGGQSLLPLLKLRLGYVSQIVDINRIDGLDTIEEDGEGLRIGGLARESALTSSVLVAERYPILADAAGVIADPLVRNRATIGGNLAHGDPANDHPAVMLALGALVIATGPDGERAIGIDDFFVGPFMTALEHSEILTEIRIPAPGPRSGGAYLKLERKVGDYATAGAAVQLSLAEDGTVGNVGIGLTNVGGTPVRANAAQERLAGGVADEAAVAEAGQLAAEASDPGEDWRGSVDYKRDMARVLTMRAVRKAIERAGGQ